MDSNEFLENLAPSVRMHFITTSMEPLMTPEKAETEQNDVLDNQGAWYTISHGVNRK